MILAVGSDLTGLRYRDINADASERGLMHKYISE